MQVTQKNGTLEFSIRVVPRSSRSEIVMDQNGELKLRITSPPVNGAANAEVVQLLAKHLNIPKRNVEIVSGHTSRTKRVRILGLDREDLLGKSVVNPLGGQPVLRTKN